jgi:hypothetical protein
MLNGIFKFNEINQTEINDTNFFTAAKKIKSLTKNDFTMNSETVQNAHIGKTKIDDLSYIYIESKKRFKLYTEETDLVFIISGNGFIKWSRGEKIFSKDDLLLFKGVKEYELNGESVFIVFKN